MGAIVSRATESGFAACNQGWLEASSLSCTLSCDDAGFARCFGGGL